MDFALQQVSRNTVAVVDEKLASNAGAVILDSFIVAVDATMRPDTSRAFRVMLEERFDRPVKYLCVTHYHGDHVFGLKPFKDATIFASTPFADNLRRRMQTDWTPEALAAWKLEEPDAAWIDEVEFIIPPVLFERRLVIADRGRSVEFRHAGGHTSCSVHAYFAAEKVLFAGDLIFAGRIPYAGDATCDPEDWIAALKTWLDLEIEYVIPGHGPVADPGEIRRQLEFMELLKTATIGAVAAGRTYQEIALPDIHQMGPEDSPLAERTRKHWYEYYSKGR